MKKLILAGIVVVLLAASAQRASAAADPAKPLLVKADDIFSELQKDPQFLKSEASWKLEAHLAVLWYASHERDSDLSVAYAREIKSSCYSSLALATIAAECIKTSPEEALLYALGAQERALTNDSGPPCLHFAMELTPLFDGERARVLLAASRINCRSAFDDAATVLLAKQTVALNPGGVEALMKDFTSDRFKGSRGVQDLARANAKAHPEWAAKKLKDFYDAAKNWPGGDSVATYLLIDDVLGDPPAALEKIKSLPEDRQEEARHWVAAQLHDAGRVKEAWALANDAQKRIDAKAPNTEWIAKVLPEVKRHWEWEDNEVKAKPVVFDAAAVDAFLAAPEQRGLMSVISQPIVFSSRQQALKFVGVALPLARHFAIAGLDMDMDPRDYLLGRLSQIAAVAWDPGLAGSIAGEITFPQARAFYLLNAYETFHPLPEVTRGWPMRFKQVGTVEIGK